MFLLKTLSLVQKKMISTPYKSPSVLQKKVLNFELKFEMKLWLIDAKNIGVSTNIVVRLSYRRSF